VKAHLTTLLIRHDSKIIAREYNVILPSKSRGEIRNKFPLI
jgi:hypothetical protein